MDDQTRKYIAKYVEDMHSLIRHGLQPIGRQMDESQMKDHPEAAAFVREAHRTLQDHYSQLERRLDALGSSPTTGVQDAASAVAGVVAGVYNHVRSEAASKSVRDDYTFLSHCCVAWMMLMTTARSLGDHDTEELGEQGYRDCSRLIMHINRIMPTLLFQEMKQDGLPAQDVSAWAHDQISKAWSHQSAGMPM